MRSDMRELAPRDYPAQLREMPQPPKNLWMRGNFPAKSMKYLRVVGSHALTSYGREACTKLIEGLADYPVCIVSGLALSTGAHAHRSALNAGLPTVAMPGPDISDMHIAPKTNFGLVRDILSSGGALLTEHGADGLCKEAFGLWRRV